MPVPDPTGQHLSRRAFSEPRAGSGLRDVDAAERVNRLRALTYGLFGAVLGGLLGFFLLNQGYPLWVAALCVAGGWVAVTGGTLLLVHGAGGAASSLYAPTSGATPRRKEHSRAEALVARGLYEEAVTAFELAVAEDPADAIAYLRIARVYRDHMGRHEDAARWFRRALREAQIQPGHATLARRELVEVYTHRLREPRRALPELARMAEELEGTPDGAWAAERLREIRSELSDG